MAVLASLVLLLPPHAVNANAPTPTRDTIVFMASVLTQIIVAAKDL